MEVPGAGEVRGLRPEALEGAPEPVVPVGHHVFRLIVELAEEALLGRLVTLRISPEEPELRDAAAAFLGCLDGPVVIGEGSHDVEGVADAACGPALEGEMINDQHLGPGALEVLGAEDGGVRATQSRASQPYLVTFFPARRRAARLASR